MLKQSTIAHVVYSFGAGGIENGIVNLINMLSKEDFFHVICCLTDSGEFSQRLKGDNWRIVELHKRPGNDLHIPLKLRKAFIKHKIDIVHLRGWPTLVEGIVASRLAGISKIIYAFHGKTFHEIQSNKTIRRVIESLAVRLVKKILTLSEAMQADLCKQLCVDAKRVSIIHNGVDIFRISQSTSRQLIRNVYNILEDEILIGSVGRLDPVKNYETLINSFAELYLIQKKKVKLMIVGDGSELEYLKNIVAQNKICDVVVFPGYREDVENYLAAMDIYVQPSLYEGFSNTIIEAMAARLPVVATNVGGNPLLFPGEEGCMLFQPQDAATLLSKLCNLCDSNTLRNDIGSRNFDMVEKKYSINRMVTEYGNLYRELLSEQ